MRSSRTLGGHDCGQKAPLVASEKLQVAAILETGEITPPQFMGVIKLWRRGCGNGTT